MPQYLYENQETGEVKEVYQSINDKHEYSEGGVKWRRVFTVPQAAIDSKWDHNNPKDFVAKTAQKKGTVQDLWDKSAELSLKREKERGADPVKKQYIEDYKKSHRGIEPPDVRRQKLKESLKGNKIFTYSEE